MRPTLATTPGVFFGPRLLLGLDVEIGLAVPKPPPSPAQIVPDIRQQEPRCPLLRELADMHQLMGEQRPVALGAAVVAQEDDRTDRHPVRSVRQQRHLDHPDPLGEGARQHVVGDEFGTLEATHTPTVRAVACATRRA